MIVRRREIVGIVIAIVLAGCGGRSGGSRDVALIVKAARAPLEAGVQHDVWAFCAAYTPQAARQLVSDPGPRVAGGCEDAVRGFVDNPDFAQLQRRALAALRVSDVVIRGRRATARIRYIAGGAGSVETFLKAPDGHWHIAAVDSSSRVTTIIR